MNIFKTTKMNASSGVYLLYGEALSASIQSHGAAALHSRAEEDGLIAEHLPLLANRTLT